MPSGDVHVLPNDGTHVASKDCWCKPTLDEATKHAVAQGLSTGNVWIHNKPN